MFDDRTFVAISHFNNRPMPKGGIDSLCQRIKAIYGLTTLTYIGEVGTLILLRKSGDNEEKIIQAFDKGRITLDKNGRILDNSIDGAQTVSAEIAFNPSIKSASISVREIGPWKIFFSLGQNAVYCGTDPGLVSVIRFGDMTSLNRRYILNTLRMGPHLTTYSPFQDVFQVPFGATVQFSPTDFQYFPLNDLLKPSTSSQAFTDSEWEKACLGILTDAVLESIGTEKRIGVLVSGGLDSSLIFKIASTQLKGHIECIPIHLYYPGSPTSNEYQFVELLFADGRAPIVINMDEAIQLNGNTMPNDVSIYSEPHREFLTAGMWIKFYPKLKEFGIRKILTGFGGDQLFIQQAGSPLHLLFKFRKRAGVSEWLGELYQWSLMRRITCWEALLALLVDLIGMFPMIKQNHWKHRLDLPPLRDQNLENWIIEFLEETKAFRRWQTFSLLHSFATVDKALCLQDLEIDHPFSSPKVMRFSLSVPLDQHLGMGYDRYLERRVSQLIGVPDKIAWRNSKGGIIEPVIRSVRKEYNSLIRFLEESLAHKMGLLDYHEILEMFWGTLAGDLDLADKFLNFYMIEGWLRTRPELCMQ